MDARIIAGAAALFFLLSGKKSSASGGNGYQDDDDANPSESEGGGGAWKKALQGKLKTDVDPPSDPLPVPDPKGPGGFASPGPGGSQPEPIDRQALDQPGGEWPRLGSFYQVAAGDSLSEISERALMDGVFRAYGLAYDVPPGPSGEYPGEHQDRAIGLVKAMADNPLNAKFRILIMSSPWNDSIYGTYGVGSGWRGPCGRGIRMIKKYADNRSRILSGLRPYRSIPVRSPEKTSNAARFPGGSSDPWYGLSYPYLWIPDIDLRSLIIYGGNIPSLAPSSSWEIPIWDDASYGMINPPPEISSEGFGANQDPEDIAELDASEIPFWGCGDYRRENWIKL